MKLCGTVPILQTADCGRSTCSLSLIAEKAHRQCRDSDSVASIAVVVRMLLLRCLSCCDRDRVRCSARRCLQRIGLGLADVDLWCTHTHTHTHTQTCSRAPSPPFTRAHTHTHTYAHTEDELHPEQLSLSQQNTARKMQLVMMVRVFVETDTLMSTPPDTFATPFVSSQPLPPTHNARKQPAARAWESLFGKSPRKDSKDRKTSSKELGAASSLVNLGTAGSASLVNIVRTSSDDDAKLRSNLLATYEMAEWLLFDYEMSW